MNLVAHGNQAPVTVSAMPENQVRRSGHPARRGKLAASVSASMLAGTTLLAACGGAGSAESGHASNTNSQSTNVGVGNGESGSPSAEVKVTFDSQAGSHVTSGFSNVIQVYPGPLENPNDEQENGTFMNAQTAEATCVITGRTVHADTNVGERPGQSDKWVELTMGSFATELYLHPSTKLAQLPECQGVS